MSEGMKTCYKYLELTGRSCFPAVQLLDDELRSASLIITTFTLFAMSNFFKSTFFHHEADVLNVNFQSSFFRIVYGKIIIVGLQLMFFLNQE